MDEFSVKMITPKVENEIDDNVWSTNMNMRLS